MFITAHCTAEPMGIDGRSWTSRSANPPSQEWVQWVWTIPTILDRAHRMRSPEKEAKPGSRAAAVR
jgi:hypothetical protein